MAVLATDNFNRADAGLGGPDWATVTGMGNLSVVSNVIAGTSGADRGSYHVGVTWPADQYSQCVATLSGGANADGGALVRCDSSSATFYLGTFGSYGTVGLYKCVSGSYTTLATTSRTLVAGDVLRLEVSGSNLNLKMNGVSVLTATDSAITAGAPGMYFYQCDGIDDWEGGDLVVATTTGRGLLLGVG